MKTSMRDLVGLAPAGVMPVSCSYHVKNRSPFVGCLHQDEEESIRTKCTASIEIHPYSNNECVKRPLAQWKRAFY